MHCPLSPTHAQLAPLPADITHTHLKTKQQRRQPSQGMVVDVCNCSIQEFKARLGSSPLQLVIKSRKIILVRSEGNSNLAKLQKAVQK